MRFLAILRTKLITLWSFLLDRCPDCSTSMESNGIGTYCPECMRREYAELGLEVRS